MWVQDSSENSAERSLLLCPQLLVSLLRGGVSNPYLLKTLLRSLLWKTKNLEHPFRKKISRAMSYKEKPFYCS